MTLMLLGLLLFVGMHSTPMLAPAWRGRMVARLGLMPWKGVYTALSLAGFVLIVIGFAQARQAPTLVHAPALALRHLNSLITLAAFVLVLAAYVPRTHFKAWLRHPMLAGTALWAGGHLLATAWLHDYVLFGALFVWALASFFALRRRDVRAGVRPAAGTLAGDAIAIVLGVAGWAVFAFWLHLWLIGVKPIA